jgi:hypothetical protein
MDIGDSVEINDGKVARWYDRPKMISNFAKFLQHRPYFCIASVFK